MTEAELAERWDTLARVPWDELTEEFRAIMRQVFAPAEIPPPSRAFDITE